MGLTNPRKARKLRIQLTPSVVLVVLVFSSEIRVMVHAIYHQLCITQNQNLFAHVFFKS